jgi:hypothetical protein
MAPHPVVMRRRAGEQKSNQAHASTGHRVNLTVMSQLPAIAVPQRRLSRMARLLLYPTTPCASRCGANQERVMTLSHTRRGLAAGAAVLPASFFIGSAQAQSSFGASTLERVTNTKQLRLAVVSGSPPYFKKDLATGAWAGAAIEMAKGIASVWGADLVFVETTWGNSVLDLQSNKIDIAFGLNPTPQRALAIGFTRPYIVAPFGCLAKAGFAPKTWDELNKPEIRIAFDLGSLHEVSTSVSWRCRLAEPTQRSSPRRSG